MFHPSVEVLNCVPPCLASPFWCGIYTFELVISLSKVKPLAFFRVSPAGRLVLNSWPLFGPQFFLHGRHQDMLSRCGLFLLVVWWGSSVHVIQGLNTDSRRWGWNENRGPLSLITNTACHCGCIIVWTVDFRFFTWQLKSLAAAGRVCGTSE